MAEYYEYRARSYSPLLQALKVRNGLDPNHLPQPRTRLSSPDHHDGAAYGEGIKGKLWKAPKPSQGDFVLIDSLAAGNRPDLAAIAGEDPLEIDPPAEPEGLAPNDRLNEEEEHDLHAMTNNVVVTNDLRFSGFTSTASILTVPASPVAPLLARFPTDPNRANKNNSARVGERMHYTISQDMTAGGIGRRRGKNLVALGRRDCRPQR